mgnify:FL=1
MAHKFHNILIRVITITENSKADTPRGASLLSRDMSEQLAGQT